MQKVLIYNDCRVFGGHEIMSAEVANSLSARYRVCFFFYHEKFRGLLNQEVEPRHLPLSSPVSFAGIRSFNPFHISYLKRLISETAPDLSIICQGSIEYCLKGLLASKISGIRTVSYVPMAFSFREMGIALGRARDTINEYLYNVPDAFITVSDEQRALIQKHLNTEKEIAVLNNFIDTELPAEAGTKRYSGGRLKIGLIGGVNFRTKGQDRAVRIAVELKAMGIDFEINVIGEGRDREKLRKLVNEQGLRDRFIYRGWLDDKKEIYSDLDIVLIPSNFEAFPLTMLESLLMNKPVFGPDQGVFREYLPAGLLFRNENEAAQKISGFTSCSGSVYDSIAKVREKVITVLSRENFERILFDTIKSMTA